MKYRNDFDVVFATSSRFGTGFLGYIISKFFNKKLTLDIRDIFSDSLSSLKVFRFKVFSIIIKLIKYFEKKICNEADWLNFVSPGFLEYKHLELNSYRSEIFTNGIDEIFIKNRQNSFKRNNYNNKLIITYAGNIGFGQGLESTIPSIAKHFKNKIIFRIIGDGSAKHIIKKELSKINLSNIELYKPVSREKLIEYYNSSDVLFLQLNNISAFDKVIPSKIFDYGSFDKPILAGVSGIAKNFIEKNLPHSFVYPPGNYKKAINFIDEIMNYDFSKINNNSFVDKFNRKIIMDKMIESIAARII